MGVCRGGNECEWIVMVPSIPATRTAIRSTAAVSTRALPRSSRQRGGLVQSQSEPGRFCRENSKNRDRKNDSDNSNDKCLNSGVPDII